MNRGTGEPIVVSGAGVVAPGAIGRAAFAAALAAVPRETPLSDAQPATRVENFEASALPDAKSLRRATPHVLYGIAAAREALAGADAGVPAEECALLLASMLGSSNFSYRLWQELIKSGPLGASPVLFSEGVPNALAGHVARTQRLLGPGQMLGGGSDCGLRALMVARDLLDSGRARRAVVGAAEEGCELAQRAYERFGIARRAQPARRRPRGAPLSEGAAVLRLECARDAGGSALACVAAVEGVRLPSLRGEAAAEELARLFVRAFEAAGVRPADAWLASAANGTAADALEGAALTLLRRDGKAPARGRSTRVRALFGEAFTATPLLQVVEALDVVAQGTPAALLALSPFASATLAVFTPAGGAT